MNYGSWIAVGAVVFLVGWLALETWARRDGIEDALARRLETWLRRLELRHAQRMGRKVPVAPRPTLATQKARENDARFWQIVAEAEAEFLYRRTEDDS